MGASRPLPTYAAGCLHSGAAGTRLPCRFVTQVHTGTVGNCIGDYSTITFSLLWCRVVPSFL
jgi:hypothetical protein